MGLFLSCDVFVEYISIKLFIFIWNTMNYFVKLKVVVVSSKLLKYSKSLPYDITVNTCYNGWMMLSGDQGDVTMD